MHLHKQTCPLSWELGGYASVQVLKDCHTLCAGGSYKDKLEKNFVHFLKDSRSMQVLLSSYSSACNYNYNYNRRIAWLNSLKSAATKFISRGKGKRFATKHHQTLAQAAFNFQINDIVSCSSPFPPLQKKSQMLMSFSAIQTTADWRKVSTKHQ